MNQKILVESLSMDLLRVALGLRRGSLKMAERFKEEALKRQGELQIYATPPYLKKLLTNSGKALDANLEEDILMYSILFQNFARKFC